MGVVPRLRPLLPQVQPEQRPRDPRPTGREDGRRFRQWQTKRRQVRKGEHSIKIFGYSTTKTTSAEEGSGAGIPGPTAHRRARGHLLDHADDESPDYLRKRN
ncbi:ArdC-like ssDNA-binding domain-containing protein [Leifsonia xyli]|uniref:ArdC-like ssDNA-binding domain-containing protein n=1 Tax=Leifsonia xyli TaxID=1575 RepID=UPI003D66CD00